MTVTSANIHDLATFIDGSNTCVRQLADRFAAVATRTNAVMGASGFNVPSTPSLTSLQGLLGVWEENARYVSSIRDALIRADRYDSAGNATVADSAIADSLRAAGLDRPPDVVQLEPIELYGQLPYSGYIDDPICLANGNFVQPDLDLEVYGRAQVLSVRRTYNSRDERPGHFGRGWSSLLDVELVVADDSATYRGPDGGGAVFWRDGDRWAGGRRRRLELRAVEDGWIVVEDRDTAWRFDVGGRFVGVSTEDARVVKNTTDHGLSFHEELSGRWVAYVLDAVSGRVTAATSSDGRSVTYRFDEDGFLVGVERDVGSLTYELDVAGRVGGVVDADGIRLCSNTYDRFGRVVSQAIPTGRLTHYHYGTDGVSKATAADGVVTATMVHDRRGRLTSMIDGHGHAMRFAYDGEDNLSQIVDRAGQVTRFRHDARGNLIEREDADGRTHRWMWDEADRLEAETDRAGRTTRYLYDGPGRLPTTITSADGATITVACDLTGRPNRIIDADGVSMRLAWNADGELSQVSDGASTVTLAYDEAGRFLGVEVVDGPSAYAQVDQAGRLVELTNADGAQRLSYTDAGRISGGVDLTGVAWSVERDLAGEVVAVERGGRTVRTTERDDVGRAIAQGDGAAFRLVLELDALGRNVAFTEPDGRRTAYEYDAEGLLTGRTDPAGHTTVIARDHRGQVSRVALPGGGTWDLTYHPEGELAGVTDPGGHQWRYDVDAVGRVVAATDPLGGVTSYGYTPGGRLAWTRSPTGRIVRYLYDGAGRLDRVVEPNGTEVTLERGPDGSVVRAMRGGEETTLDYDGAGRLTAIAGPWSTWSIERKAGQIVTTAFGGATPSRYSYDARGLLERFTDSAGVVTSIARNQASLLTAHATLGVGPSFERDVVGRVTAYVDHYGERFEFGHGAGGEINRIALPGGTEFTFSSDPDGLLTSVEDGEGAVLLEFTRDAGGSIVEARAGGDGSSSIEYDAVGRVGRVRHGSGTVEHRWDGDGCLVGLADNTGHIVDIERDEQGDPVRFRSNRGPSVNAPAQPSIRRDAAGRITVDEAGRQFTYDQAGRLASATVNGSTTTYGYDARGLLAVEDGPRGTRRYAYGLAGEVRQITDDDGNHVSFFYDREGRRTSEERNDGGARSYEWDVLGRLVRVATRQGDGTELSRRIDYDPFGQPMFVDDIPVLWAAVGYGNLLGIGEDRFVHAGSQVCAFSSVDRSWSRYTFDDPWGLDGRSGVRLGFRGELMVDDLVFLGARVYDAASRSFLSRDPLPPMPGERSFAGAYTYAGCDPVNLVDPTGLKPLSDEEYSEFKKRAEAKLWKKAAVFVVGIAVMAVVTPVLGPVGLVLAAGVVGAAVNGTNEWIDGGSPGEIVKAAVIGGLAGALTAGLGSAGIRGATSMGGYVQANVGRNLGIDSTLSVTEELADSYIGPGADRKFNPESVLINIGIGAVGGSISDGLNYRTNLHRINHADIGDLQNVRGIGPVLSQRIIDRRNDLGAFGAPAQLEAIPGIGQSRLDSLWNGRQMDW